MVTQRYRQHGGIVQTALRIASSFLFLSFFLLSFSFSFSLFFLFFPSFLAGDNMKKMPMGVKIPCCRRLIDGLSGTPPVEFQ